MVVDAQGVNIASGECIVLAVDLGTSGCKCALVGLSGTVYAWSFKPVQLHVNGVCAEQEPNDWWAAFLHSAGELLANNSVLSRRVSAICCSTQSEGTVCVDRAGNAIGRAMLWLDMRGRDAIKRRAQGLAINVGGYGPLKLWRWVRRTGGAPALTGQDCAGHITFIREYLPGIYERTHKFLNVLDYMNLRMTGRFCATHDSILTAWVTDNRDPSKIRYDPGLLRMVGIDAEKLPETVPSTEILGSLLPDVASMLGLPPNTLVVAGSVDTSAVAVGAAVSDFFPHLYLGTSSWLGAHVAKMKTDVRSKIAAVPCAVHGRYLATALQTTAGANLSFLRDRILYHPDELLSNEEQPDVYALLDVIAERVPAGARGLIYTPWLYGERSPVDDPTLRAALVNLSLEHSREDIIRAFLEGVALNTRWMLEPFNRFLGQAPQAITAVGGGAQSDVWCQIMADMTGHPIWQPRNPIKTNAIGSAFIAGVGMGVLSFADLRDSQRPHRVYEPQSKNRQVYDDRFETFKEVRQRLSPLYQRINGNREVTA
ncbi:xylulose kinase [Burkholderia ubonensis]|uniref:xylulokinase n=1 Tax=Burkholderia ubonensis TaxID=101571 RepID=UPI00075475C9|nr:FGGY-family carbohydrate kinase [Burkholderia ubonensis]KWA74743.1 xylulose kinase [Burkholderia ubonensis]KWB30344.1 xylulose kinase [Burkholderia ubonensis]